MIDEMNPCIPEKCNNLLCHELLEMMKPITRDNIDRLRLGEWIWDNHSIEKSKHGKKLGWDKIQEPIGFRQVHIIEDDPFIRNHSSIVFMLSDTYRGGYYWEYFEEGRFYMFRKEK